MLILKFINGTQTNPVFKASRWLSALESSIKPYLTVKRDDFGNFTARLLHSEVLVNIFSR